jgi:hypothetical protein
LGDVAPHLGEIASIPRVRLRRPEDSEPAQLLQAVVVYT